MRPESNTFLVDGMRDINRMDGGYAYRPPADTMAEFRILTTTAPAEFGGTSGGITTIVTRSGTNQFHGTLYEFLRNDALNANNYFAPPWSLLYWLRFVVWARCGFSGVFGMG